MYKYFYKYITEEINSLVQINNYAPGYIVSFILYIILSLFTFYIFFKRVLGFKYRTSYTLILYFILENLFSVIIVNIGNVPDIYKWVLSIIVYCVTIANVLFKGEFSKKVIAVVIYVCFNEICQYICVPLTIMCHNVDNLNNIHEALILRCILINAGLIGSAVINLLILNFVSKYLYINDSFKNIKYTLLFVLPNIFITFILGQYFDVYFKLHKNLGDGYFVYIKLVLLSCTALICALFTVINLEKLLMANSRREKQVLLKQQFDVQVNYCKRMQIQFESLRAFRHDVRNHLICIKNLILQNKSEDAVKYAENITESMENLNTKINTGNPVADAIISEKYSECLNNNIEFKCDVLVPGKAKINSLDLCVILGNALDNSMEACELIEDESVKKYIHIRSYLIKSFIVFEIKNSMDSCISKKDIIGDEDYDLNHGLGLLNIKNTVDKYFGTVSTEENDNKFMLSIMLQV